MKNKKASTVPTSKNSANSTDFESRADLTENDDAGKVDECPLL